MDNNTALVSLTLTPQHARRLRSLLVEEMGRVETYRRASSSRSVGYLSTLDDISADLGDVFEQLVNAVPQTAGV